MLVLRADLNGEGGTFAMMSLAQQKSRRSKTAILMLGVIGTCFLYGDAAITPALSVISAIEGMTVIAPAFEKAVLPLSIVILIGLFAVQSRGTAKMAAYFGPIIVVWFTVLGGMGVVWICASPVCSSPSARSTPSSSCSIRVDRVSRPWASCSSP